jgi:uncharacterized membrane protein YhiD involved in acid resistance
MIQNFEQYMATSSTNLPIMGFVINLILSAILSVVLASVYTRYGNALSNREQFSKNFLLITMTTMLVISVVKSSLALSLGLVGALSIIRFRAAIKEPEELGYIFLAVAIGLGLGANQTMITMIALLIIVAIIILFSILSRRGGKANQNLQVTIQSTISPKITIQIILDILEKNCITVNLNRYDENNAGIEGSFLIEVESFDDIVLAKDELAKLSEGLRFTFLDNKGLL